jgi:hypothetical protein
MTTSARRNSVADNVRAELVRRDTHQLELVNLLGIPRSSVSRRWRGETPWLPDQLEAIARHLNPGDPLAMIRRFFGEETLAPAPANAETPAPTPRDQFRNAVNKSLLDAAVALGEAPASANVDQTTQHVRKYDASKNVRRIRQTADVMKTTARRLARLATDLARLATDLEKRQLWESAR